MIKNDKTNSMSKKVFNVVILASIIIFCSCSEKNELYNPRDGDILTQGIYNSNSSCSEDGVKIYITEYPFTATFVSFGKKTSSDKDWYAFANLGKVKVGDTLLKDVSWESGSWYSCQCLKRYYNSSSYDGIVYKVGWINSTMRVSKDGNKISFGDGSIDSWYKCSNSPSGGSGGGGTTSEKGSIMFWSSEDNIYYGNTIRVDLLYGGVSTLNITTYYAYSTSPQNCGDIGNATFFDIPYGKYFFTAECGGKILAGEVNHNSSCTRYRISGF